MSNWIGAWLSDLAVGSVVEYRDAEFQVIGKLFGMTLLVSMEHRSYPRGTLIALDGDIAVLYDESRLPKAGKK